MYGLLENALLNKPLYRKIFPSYDWDEDGWRVNQIVNLPYILGKEKMGFVKNVPNEEVKRNDRAVQQWIDEHLFGCSCLVIFFGEKTYLSKWVKYEMIEAGHRGMGRLLINLEGVKNMNGIPCSYGIDPYAANGLYTPNPDPSIYIVRQYKWVADEGQKNISNWIEDACVRAGR